MSSIRRHWHLLLVAVCCVGLGAGVSAIASAGARTSTSSAAASNAGSAKHPAAKHARMKARGLRRLTRAVQGSAVVHTKNGFATVTFARGKVDAVNGDQLTIAEGTRTATYKTVTVTIPANAVVRDDRRTAALSDVKAGQRVLVLQAPKRTYVIARTPRTP
jgi:hypothetical protein